MIKLKQLLFESTAPNIFIPRRMDDRVDRYIKQYILEVEKLDYLAEPELEKQF